jgi:hypothetical protein
VTVGNAQHEHVEGSIASEKKIRNPSTPTISKRRSNSHLPLVVVTKAGWQSFRTRIKCICIEKRERKLPVILKPIIQVNILTKVANEIMPVSKRRKSSKALLVGGFSAQTIFNLLDICWVFDRTKTLLLWGFMPAVIYVGLNTEPRPSFFDLINIWE